MGDVAIRVEGVGKRYRIGEAQRPAYGTLRDAVMSLAHRQADRLRHPFRQRRSQASTIWALRGVSFEVPRGEVVGIIGRNGAGKSTLLKILARITEPTEGRATLHGRVGSLLEVGTGFHLELTGRENIFLNGAILGMKKAEILRKFDEIVAFAEIDKFIDTPVKHYSSGMHVRLAFAVAAHLEPEILLVDEVLAVGDAAFQKKCLGKMGDVAKGGRTVLFVSHNMPSVQRLCLRCVRLDAGAVVLDGPADDVVHEYLSATGPRASSTELPAHPDKAMRLRKVRVWDGHDGPSGQIELSRPVVVEVEYDVNRPVTSSHVAIFISNADGVCIVGSGDADAAPERLGLRPPGRYRGRVAIPESLLGEGEYTVTVTLGVPYLEVHDRHEAIVRFEVHDTSSRRREYQHRRRPGVLGLELPWQVVELP